MTTGNQTKGRTGLAGFMANPDFLQGFNDIRDGVAWQNWNAGHHYELGRQFAVARPLVKYIMRSETAVSAYAIKEFIDACKVGEIVARIRY